MVQRLVAERRKLTEINLEKYLKEVFSQEGKQKN